MSVPPLAVSMTSISVCHRLVDARAGWCADVGGASIADRSLCRPAARPRRSHQDRQL